MKQMPEGEWLPPGLLDEEDPLPATELTEEGLGRKIGVPSPTNLSSMPSREELAAKAVPVHPNELLLPFVGLALFAFLSEKETKLAGYIIPKGTKMFAEITRVERARWQQGEWQFLVAIDGDPDIFWVHASAAPNTYLFAE